MHWLHQRMVDARVTETADWWDHLVGKPGLLVSRLVKTNQGKKLKIVMLEMGLSSGLLGTKW